MYNQVKSVFRKLLPSLASVSHQGLLEWIPGPFKDHRVVALYRGPCIVALPYDGEKDRVFSGMRFWFNFTGCETTKSFRSSWVPESYPT